MGTCREENSCRAPAADSSLLLFGRRRSIDFQGFSRVSSEFASARFLGPFQGFFRLVMVRRERKVDERTRRGRRRQRRYRTGANGLRLGFGNVGDFVTDFNQLRDEVQYLFIFFYHLSSSSRFTIGPFRQPRVSILLVSQTVQDSKRIFPPRRAVNRSIQFSPNLHQIHHPPEK